jgi:adenosylhomocysteine nucleosidase
MINIVTALPAEARPLREHFKLCDKLQNTAFPLYRNADIALIVAGPGKVAAAAATAVLASAAPAATTSAWLNVGIAGHAHHAIGSAFIAHRITDQANGSRWYPPQTLERSLPTENLRTVDLPEDNYPKDAVYDMEASGFYPVACRFSSSELVQCLKIISDNRAQPAIAVTAKLCSQLVTDRLADIEQLANALSGLAGEYNRWHAPHPELAQLAARWHFSVSQQHQLQQLGRRWQALAGEESIMLDELQKKNSATEVLQSLRQHLDTLATNA